MLPSNANKCKITDYEQCQHDAIYQTKDTTNWEPDRDTGYAKDDPTDKPEQIKIRGMFFK